jgi:hypothetical protein
VLGTWPFGGAVNLTVLEFRGVAYRDTVPDGTPSSSPVSGSLPRGIAIGRVNGVRREELG